MTRVHTPHGLGHQPAKKLAQNASHTLHGAKIPSVLFGWLPLALYGCTKVLTEVDLIVPDETIPRAIETLLDDGYDMCTSHLCRETEVDRLEYFPHDARISEINRYHSVPAAHFHLKHGAYVLSLHPKSRLLWWMPPFELECPKREDPCYVLTSDERLPAPGFDEDGPTRPWVNGDPVRMLKPCEMDEALQRLYLYEEDKGMEGAQGWMGMLRELLEAERRAGGVFMDLYK